MIDITVFHAGQEPLSSFRPCVHVGTREAALERLNGRRGYLHECNLISSGQIIELEDWGSNTGSALFCSLHDYFKKNGKILEQEFFDGARALINHAKANHASVSREIQETFLCAQLYSRGISLIKYRNHVEHAGSDSYFVLDPQLLSVVKVVKV